MEKNQSIPEMLADLLDLTKTTTEEKQFNLNKQIEDAVRYDRARIELENKYSNALLYVNHFSIKNTNDKTANLSDGQLVDLHVVLDGHNQVYIAKHNWLNYENTLKFEENQDEDEFYFVFVPTFSGVKKVNTNWLSYRILESVKNPIKISGLMDLIVQEIEVAEKDKHLLQRILAQTPELIKALIIKVV